MNNDEYLEHFGIKGMKWGVRRYQNKDGTLTAAGKKRKQSQRKSIDDELKEMSDQELRAKINRLQMEQQYRSLVSKDQSNGKNATRRALKTIGKVTVKAITIAGIYGGAKALGEKYGLNEQQVTGLDRAMKVARILGQG